MKPLILINLVWLLLVWSPALAKLDIEVSPIRAEHQIQPGETETNVVRVQNLGDEPLRIRVSLQDWQLERRGELRFMRPGTHSRSLARWLELNPTDFQLQPGQMGEIRYTLTVPTTAASGSYWTALIVDSQAVKPGIVTPKRMAMVGRIAVMLYNTVGKPEISGKFESFQVVPERHRVKFILTLTNPGQVFFRPRRSKISVKDSQGKEVAQVEVPDAPVLPGTTRDLIWTRELQLRPGQYQAEALLDIGRRELLQRQQTFKIGP